MTALTVEKAWPGVFLAALESSGNVSAAAREAGVSRQRAYEWRRSDPDFASHWDAAIEVATDALEAEARRRAVEGTEEPVFYQGTECGRIRRYSDTLMIVLLKAHRPAKFRENAAVEHSGDLRVRVEYVDGHADAPASAPEAG